MASQRLNFNRKKVAFAFGGGGIHGAAHAGFLEAFFEKFPDCNVHSMSGTSAGAVTATAAAIGIHQNGKKGAIQSLHRIWHGLKNTGLVDHPINLRSLERLSGLESLPSWIGMAKSHGRMMEQVFPFWGHLYNSHIKQTFRLDGTFNTAARNLVNPQGKNHLMQFIKRNFDFSFIRSKKIPKLFINAVDTRTQENVIFSNDDINEYTLTASGTLPFLWAPVRYKGRNLVDGKYRANPPILPHLDENVDEIVVVSLGKIADEPVLQEELKKAEDILKDRAEKGFKTPRIHVIEIGLEGQMLSKLNTNDTYVDSLINKGKQAFNKWFFGASSPKTDIRLKLSA